MKKTFAIVLSLFIILTALPFGAVAEESAYDVIYKHLKNNGGILDLNSYNLTLDELEEHIQNAIVYDPDLFNATGAFSYHFNSKGYISMFAPQYRFEGAALEEAKTFVESETAKIIATVPTGLEDSEIALYIHDYLCVNFEYDERATEAATVDDAIYDIYNMLSQKKGVCQAYSLLYDKLLSSFGIEVLPVVSDEMVHMWNQVLIDGEWYHIDVTWDDPLYEGYGNIFGKARHKYFMLSDTGIASAHGTANFTADNVCDETYYDTAFWANVDIPFGFANGKTYCLIDDTIINVDMYTLETEDVYYIDAVWSVPSGSYSVCLSGFGSYDNKLIFNTDKEIKCLDPATMKLANAATVGVGTDNIYLMYVSGDTAHYMHSEYYSVTGTAESAPIKIASSGPIVLPDDPFDESTEDSSEDSSIEESTEYSSEDSSVEESSEDSSEDSSVEESSEYSSEDSSVEESSEDSSEDSSIEESTEYSSEDSSIEDSSDDSSVPDISDDYDVGDVNGDGAVDQYDYLLVKRAYFSTYTFTEEAEKRADVNYDRTVDQYDYLLIKRVYFGTYTITKK